jgi:cytochrome bd-type quinol oxidase subunit 2
LLLLIVAAALVIGLVRVDTKTIVTYSDGSVRSTLDADPIVALSESGSDFACFAGSPCRLRAAARIEGLFARTGVPPFFALCAGVFAPFLLISAALIVLISPPRRISQIVRVLIGMLLFVGAAYLVAQLGTIPFDADRPFETVLHFWPVLIIPAVGLGVLAAAMLLLKGVYKPGTASR